jgi:hypothetical protein
MNLNVVNAQWVERLYNAHAMQQWGCPELTELHKGAGPRAAAAQSLHISVVLTNHNSRQRHRILQPFRAVTDYLRQPLEQHRSPLLYSPHTSNDTILTWSASQRSPTKGCHVVVRADVEHMGPLACVEEERGASQVSRLPGSPIWFTQRHTAMLACCWRWWWWCCCCCLLARCCCCCCCCRC